MLLLLSPSPLLAALLVLLPLMSQAQYDPRCDDQCPHGYHCCYGDTKCCPQNYYYTSWWFWLIWVILIFISTCCYYYRRRRYNNYAAHVRANRRRPIVTSSPDDDLESESSMTAERMPNSVIPMTPEEMELFKDLPPEYAVAVGPPPPYGDTVEQESPPEYTEN